MCVGGGVSDSVCVVSLGHQGYCTMIFSVFLICGYISTNSIYQSNCGRVLWIGSLEFTCWDAHQHIFQELESHIKYPVVWGIHYSVGSVM